VICPELFREVLENIACVDEHAFTVLVYDPGRYQRFLARTDALLELTGPE